MSSASEKNGSLSDFICMPLRLKLIGILILSTRIDPSYLTCIRIRNADTDTDPESWNRGLSLAKKINMFFI